MSIKALKECDQDVNRAGEYLIVLGQEKEESITKLSDQLEYSPIETIILLDLSGGKIDYAA